MSILPPEVRAGYVYDRVLRAIGDRPYDDDRLPDGIPAQGRVIFRPKTSVKQIVSDGRGVTITREPVTCTIHQGENQSDDSDASKGGLLIDEAGAVGGVWLVVGEWTVEYHMEDRYSNIPNEEIIVTEEHTEDNPLDVALASEITPTPIQKFVVNEQIYVDTLAARDEVRDNLHDMVISGEVVGDDLHLSQHGGDSIVAGNVRGPRGPQGIQGPMGTLELIGGDNPAITVDTSVGTRVYVGNTMIHGDTGWRNIRTLTQNLDFDSLQQHSSNIRRIGNVVYFSFRFRAPAGRQGSPAAFTIMEGTLPAGFRESPVVYSSFGTTYRNSADYLLLSNLGGDASVSLYSNFPLGNGAYAVKGSYVTSQSWPTSLPGTPL